MKFIISIWFLFFAFNVLSGQFAKGKLIPEAEHVVNKDFNDVSVKLSSTITTNELRSHLNTLSSDIYEGRETGTRGNEKAAQYLAQEFERLGLPKIGDDKNYFQNVDFTFSSWKKSQLKVGGRKLKLLRDFVGFPQFSVTDNIEADKITFLGYGIDDAGYSDYEGVDTRDQVLMVFDGEPIDKNGQSLVNASTELSKWSTNWHLKSEAAKKHGVRLLLIISNDFNGLIRNNRSQLINQTTQLGDLSSNSIFGANTMFISPVIAEEILGTQREQIIQLRNSLITGSADKLIVSVSNSVEAKLDVKREVLSGQNILGFIEGTDLKNEIVIVSAHYDHLGKRGGEIYHGADDNASGTSAVLEIAEALATAKKMNLGPKRSVLCLLVTGEEKGLLGSEYYSERPLFPINNTVVDVNIDMVGRKDKEYESQKEDYIYVIGSDRLSLDLHHINEEMSYKYSHLLLDYKYNDAKDPNRFYFRSDHYNFAKSGVPSIFFFNGIHADYHRLTDTADKIDFELMQKRTRHIFHTVWELSNRNQRIRLNPTSTDSP